MPNVVLVCLDEIPPTEGGTCTTTAWVEQPALPFPELSIADAQSLSMTALVAFAVVGAALLVRKAV